MNPEFKVISKYFDITLKLLSEKNTQKVNKQNIQDSYNWVFNELNKIKEF